MRHEESPWYEPRVINPQAELIGDALAQTIKDSRTLIDTQINDQGEHEFFGETELGILIALEWAKWKFIPKDKLAQYHLVRGEQVKATDKKATEIMVQFLENSFNHTPVYKNAAESTMAKMVDAYSQGLNVFEIYAHVHELISGRL